MNKFNVWECDLRKLNSMTKYPSILTLLYQNNVGMLEDSLNVFFGKEEPLYVTEKVDGTNARIILLPDENILFGGRETLLGRYKELLYDPSLSVVPTLTKIVSESGLYKCIDTSLIRVIYGEVYGGAIGSSSRNYTDSKEQTGFRIFDISELSLPTFFDLNSVDLSRVSQWRENGGQSWNSVFEISTFTSSFHIETVPSVYNCLGEHIPTTIEDGMYFLQNSFKQSRAKISQGGLGEAEGVVIRNVDRSKICKMRFEDYTKTIRKMNKK